MTVGHCLVEQPPFQVFTVMALMIGRLSTCTAGNARRLLTEIAALSGRSLTSDYTSNHEYNRASDRDRKRSNVCNTLTMFGVDYGTGGRHTESITHVPFSRHFAPKSGERRSFLHVSRNRTSPPSLNPPNRKSISERVQPRGEA